MKKQNGPPYNFNVTYHRPHYHRVPQWVRDHSQFIAIWFFGVMAIIAITLITILVNILQ